jgi:uncharacterized membrane protein
VNDVAEVTLYIALLASSIVAGGQLFCLLAVIPAFGDWEPRFGVSVHQHALTERPHRYLRVVSALTFIAAIAAIAIERSADAAVWLTAAGAVLAIFNGVYSRREWPINDAINKMGANPSEEQVVTYKRLRERWDSQHVVRTVASLAALACFGAAATFF